MTDYDARIAAIEATQTADRRLVDEVRADVKALLTGVTQINLTLATQAGFAKASADVTARALGLLGLVVAVANVAMQWWRR
jgi:hypothetical protein